MSARPRDQPPAASSAHPRESVDVGLCAKGQSLAPGFPRGFRRPRIIRGHGPDRLGNRRVVARKSQGSRTRRRRAPGAAIQRTVERLAFPRTPAPPWPARRRASCGALLLGPCDGGGPERVRPLLGLAVARKFPCKPLKRLIPRPEIQRPSPPTGNAAKIRRGRPLWGGRHRAARKFRRKALKRLIPRPEIPHPNSSAGGRGRSPGAGGPVGRGRHHAAREFRCKALKRLIPCPETPNPCSSPGGRGQSAGAGGPCGEGRRHAARKFRRKALKTLIPRPETPHPCSSPGGRGQSPGAGSP